MSNEITAYFKGRAGVSESLYQYDYGMVLNLDGIELPSSFECYFDTTGSDEAIPAIGTDGRVAIPNDCLSRPGDVTLHIPLHSGVNDSQVEYVVKFRVIGRARPVDSGTPEQQTAIEQALALLQNPITNIEQIVNEALAFTGDTFDEMQEQLDADQAAYESSMNNRATEFESGINNRQSTFESGISTRQTTVENQFNNLATNLTPNSKEVLWSGSTLDGTMTLSKAISNFDFIDIEYAQSGSGDVDDKTITKRIPAVAGTYVVNDFAMDYSNGLLDFYEQKLKLSNLSLIAAQNYDVTATGGSDNWVKQRGVYQFTIVRVVGIKMGSASPAELTDIRVGADNETYPSAGEAVRAQVSAIAYKANVVYGGAKTTTSVSVTNRKSWDTTIGQKVDSAARACADVIRWTPAIKSVNCASGYQVFVFANNAGEGHPLVSISAAFGSSFDLSHLDFNYIYLVVKKTDGSDFATGTTTNAISITRCSEVIPYTTHEEAKLIENKIDALTKNYPVFIRGSADVSTGIFVPSDAVMDRLIDVDYTPLDTVNELSVKSGFGAYICYYDSNKSFVSNSGDWISSSAFALDTTKAYARIVLKKLDNTSFTTIPTDAISLQNNTKEYAPKALVEATNEAIFGLFYSETGTDAGASNMHRWFFPTEFPHGWLKSIKIKDAAPISAGITTVELWQRSGNTLNRVDVLNFGTGAGTTTLTIDKAITDNTWISLSGVSAFQFGVSSTGNNPALILRNDKVSTSISRSALEAVGYSIVADIALFTNESDSSSPETHIYTIGENDNVAEIISTAMEYSGSIVYIEPYEHDCIAEWEEFYGENYFANMSSGRGMELQNDIHIIGRSGHKLKCYYTGSNDYVMENFSLFNNPRGGSGYTLENVCIDTKKIRYCIHDEREGDGTPYKVQYKRCKMSQDMTGSTWDHSRACIGGGLGLHGDILVEDCIFSTVTSEANMDSLAYHNSGANYAENSLVIRGCYCTGDSTLQLASYGESALKTKVLVTCCSFGSPVEELDWTGGTPNFDIYYINNEIRN